MTTADIKYVYLAWWQFYDPWDGSSGLLGIYTTEDAAVAAAKEYVERITADEEDGSTVTKVALDTPGTYISAYGENLHTFTPHEYWESIGGRPEELYEEEDPYEESPKEGEE